MYFIIKCMNIKINRSTIINLPRFYKRAIIFFADFFLLILSVWLAFGLILNQWGLLTGYQWFVPAFAAIFSLPLFIHHGLYRAIFRYLGSQAFLAIALVFVKYGILFFFVFTLVGVQGVPRAIGVIQPLLFFIAVGSSRYFVRYFFGDVGAKQKSIKGTQSSALIYGAGSAGRQLAASLNVNQEILLKGFVDDEASLHGRTINGLPVHSSKNVRAIVQKLKITDIFLAIPSAEQSRRNEIIVNLYDCHVRVCTLPGLLDIISGQVKFSDLHSLNMNDLLGRSAVPPNLTLLEKNIRNKVVLVTGAGGSIGSELCRQIIKFSPRELILIDSSEYSLYCIYEELKSIVGIKVDDSAQNITHVSSYASSLSVRLIPYLASVRDADLMHKIFGAHQPATVYHAAAYKHVPLVEQNPSEGIRNNVLGTLNCALASIMAGTSCFVLISTDKAVRPTNIMGASKRVAELVLQALADRCSKDGMQIQFAMVRFGNVLGSSGSVIPLFEAQIKSGGPITLTHREVTRYFMTITEAAQLVIQAGAMTISGDVFLLNMGEPVRIYELAKRLIYLSGLTLKDDSNPQGDIEIKVTGLRPGEKLYEELLIGENPQPTSHPKIMKASEEYLSWDDLELRLEKLYLALEAKDINLIKKLLKNLVPGYLASDV